MRCDAMRCTGSQAFNCVKMEWIAGVGVAEALRMGACLVPIRRLHRARVLNRRAGEGDADQPPNLICSCGRRGRVVGAEESLLPRCEVLHDLNSFSFQ